MAELEIVIICHTAMQVHLPLSATRLEELCYSDLNTTESEHKAVVQSLLHALHQLESSVGKGSPVRTVVEGGGGDWMGQYMIKREYSEASYHVFGIVVPDLRAGDDSPLQPANSTNSSEEMFQSNSLNHGSVEECDVARDGSGPGMAACHSNQCLDSSDVAASGRHAAEAADEAVDTKQLAAGGDAKLTSLEAASDMWACVGKHQPARRAAAVLHKAQAFLRPLVPQGIAQLWPVARLLGTCNSSISSETGNIQQPGFCANEGDQTKLGKGIDTSKAKGQVDLTEVPGSSMAGAQGCLSGQSLDAGSKAVSVANVLPGPQTGDAVISDILIPTRHDSSADDYYEHVDMAPGSSGSGYGVALSAELMSLLEVTADRILKESCGEGWLIQPRIADMTRLEYRVYLLNGAQAVSPSC